ncbi:unnamed protein product [Anisakis simplex]|uniref:Uncharacterized protein n=1 Tax=Anisakis simplex TaxID=6269 RepID=A0A0M3JDI5_ANISI|nr:unnamed protein product [Anisakis simplex]
MLQKKLPREGTAPQTEDSDSPVERRLHQFSSSVPISYSRFESSKSSTTIFTRRFFINQPAFTLLFQFAAVIFLIVPCSCQMPPVPSGSDRAEVDIRVSGACSPSML